MNEERIFQNVLKLVGHEVEVESRRDPKPIRGKIVNAMFDSVLIETGQSRSVVRFADIRSLLVTETAR